MRYLLLICGLVIGISFRTEAMNYTDENNNNTWKCNYFTRTARRADVNENIRGFEAYGKLDKDENQLTIFLLGIGEKDSIKTMKPFLGIIDKNYSSYNWRFNVKDTPDDPSGFHRYIVLGTADSYVFQPTGFKSGPCHKVYHDYSEKTEQNQNVIQRGLVCVGVEPIRKPGHTHLQLFGTLNFYGGSHCDHMHTYANGELVKTITTTTRMSDSSTVFEIIKKEEKIVRRIPGQPVKTIIIPVTGHGGKCPALPVEHGGNPSGLGAIESNIGCPKKPL